MNQLLCDAPCDVNSLRESLSGLLSKELRLLPHQICTQRPFTEYGLDSIAALTISGELEERYDVELPPTLLWDCPTIDQLARHLHGMLSPA